MKKNRLYLIIFCVLLIVAAIMFLSKTDVTLKKELRDFAIEDTASISRVFMVNKNNEMVNLERNQDGYWIVNGENIARQESIDLLLKTIRRIEVRAPVSETAMESVIKNLAGRNIKVEIYMKNKLKKTFYVGGATQDQRGTFMMMEGSTSPFVAHISGFSGYLTSRFFIEEDLWTDPGIFRYRPKDILSITVENGNVPDQSFKIRKNESGSFKIEPFSGIWQSSEIDTLNVNYYTTLYRNISWEFMASSFDAVRKDSITSTPFLYSVTVEDTEGKTNTITTWLKPADGKLDIEGNDLIYDDERMFAVLNNQKHFIIVQYHVFNQICLDFEAFLMQN